jgi:hypothetical protein
LSSVNAGDQPPFFARLPKLKTRTMRSGATSNSAYHRPAGKIRIVVRSADLPRPSRPPFASAAVWTAAIG